MSFSANKSTSVLSTQARVKGWVLRQTKRGWLKVTLTGLWLGFIAAHTATDSRLVQLLDHQVQTLFFDIRGARPAPDDIVILAIDDESLAQAEYYQADPERYAALAPIQTTPWERRAYAIAVERLMQAGARAVALDVLFLGNSSYGPTDDQALLKVLQRYGDKVVLASTYDNDNWRQGIITKPTLPYAPFLNTSIHTGTINFPIEADGRIHRLASAHVQDLAEQMADIVPGGQGDHPAPGATTDDGMDPDLASTQTLPQATLAAARITPPPKTGNYINFYGPDHTFTQVPFWYVLDSDPWLNQLDAGAYFKNKIVLIGSTAKIQQDFHLAPFSQTLMHPRKLAGVEILANDLATLITGNTLSRDWMPPWMRAGLVIGFGTGFGLLLWRVNRPIARLGWTLAFSGAWFWASYLGFVNGHVLLPTAAPIIGFAVIGGAFIVADIVTEQWRKQQLRQTLAQYVTSPIVQEIISQTDDLQDLLKAREAEVIGQFLGNRYQIVRLLGAGGFGETYVAQDTQRPGAPTCVVKQLKIISDDPNAHRLARRFFIGEAETLEQLGHHDQIPRLLAYFEAQYSFYLVEEMIEGVLLTEELATRDPMPQIYVLELLKGLLPIVAFVHSQGVIHRDIKPSNIIRRTSDRRLVLIDFGAVKQISHKLADTEAHITSTVGVGTQGYMPSEQSAGLPGFSSDIYAIGITAIEALTGIPAYALKRDKSGEIMWKHEVPYLEPQFANIIQKMVLYDFTERYQSADAVLHALAGVEFSLREHAKQTGQPTEVILPQPNQAAKSDLVPAEEPDLAPEGTAVLPEDWFSDETTH